MYIHEQPYRALGALVGPFEGTFTGTIQGDKASAATIKMVLTDQDNRVSGQITLGKGLKLGLGGFCVVDNIDLSSISISGQTSPDNPRYVQTSKRVTESPVNIPGVKSVDINVTIKATLSSDGNTITADVTFDPLEGVISVLGVDGKVDLKKRGCMAKTLPVTLSKQTPTGSLKGYIYDRPLTALHFLRNEQPVNFRPSQHYYYSNGRGLGADYSALHGSKESTCPDVVSPATPAEVKQLTEEIIMKAQRNAWAGVDEAYKRLESKGDQAFDLIPKGLTSVTEIHKHGAEASKLIGDTLLSQARLLREKSRLWSLKMSLEGGPSNNTGFRKTIDDLGGIDQLLGEIEKYYGAVTIAPESSKSPSKKQRAQLELLPVVRPMAPDQRKSIEFAAGKIKKYGEFKGLLPAGDYTLKLEDRSVTPPFTVKAGTEYRGNKPKDVRWGK